MKKSSTTEKKSKLFETYTPVYVWNKESKKRIKVNQGGTSSSKTISILQLITHRCLEKKITVSVIAQTSGSLTRGAVRDFKNLINGSPILAYCLKNADLKEGPFEFKNGSIIEFVNLNDPKTARHGKRDIAFLNEANYINYEAVKQILMRTAEVFIDYNPDAPFWVHDEVIGSHDADVFYSNFTHNPYCMQETIQEILKFKYNFENSGDEALRARYEKTKKFSDYVAWEKTTNAYWKNKWYVYGLGKTGIVEGVVFQHINWVPLLPLKLTKKAYAIDWGFKIDPTTLIIAGMYQGEVYAKELMYEKGLTTPQVMTRLRELGISKRDLIIADSSNPDAIAQMQNKGWNIVPAYKPPGSVKSGVNALQGMGINITDDSENWKIEAVKYKYYQKNGKFTNEPIDAWNHLFDPLRYWRQRMFDPRRVRRKGRRSRRLHIINQ